MYHFPEKLLLNATKTVDGAKWLKNLDKVIAEIAEKNIKDIEHDENNFKRYEFLLKLFDKAEIINQINLEKS